MGGGGVQGGGFGGGGGPVGQFGGTCPQGQALVHHRPTTSPCPPYHTITLTFAANWFSHASHVNLAKQDPPKFVHGYFCHIIALHFGPQQ